MNTADENVDIGRVAILPEKIVGSARPFESGRKTAQHDEESVLCPLAKRHDREAENVRELLATGREIGGGERGAKRQDGRIRRIHEPDRLTSIGTPTAKSDQGCFHVWLPPIGQRSPARSSG